MIRALAAIAVRVVIHFRWRSLVVLSLPPVFLGAVWTGGIMGAVDLPLNPANIMTPPLVVDIGVASCMVGALTLLLAVMFRQPAGEKETQ